MISWKIRQPKARRQARTARVKPSAMPITTARTDFDPVKCFPTRGVVGTIGTFFLCLIPYSSNFND